jgi:hypothetical protein
MIKNAKSIVKMISKANEKFAIFLTKALSSMICVYAFFILAVLPLAFPSLEQFCMYVSSTVIQLVALPLLAVGTTLLGKSQERRDTADHLHIRDISKEMHTLLASAKVQENNLIIALAKIEDLEKKITSL